MFETDGCGVNIPYRLEFEIMGLPRMTNSRKSSHWRVIHREAEDWKMRVILYAKSARPKVPLARAKLTLTRCSSSSPDSDGLVSGFKHVIDGLVIAGVLENDKFVNIGMPTYLWRKVPAGKGMIRVVVEEVTI